MRGLNPGLLYSLRHYPDAIVRQGHRGRSGISAHREKFGGSRPALRARSDAMAAARHPLYFTELLFPEELENFLDHAHAEAHVFAQLGQRHFTIEIQCFQRYVFKQPSADTGFLDLVWRKSNYILHLISPIDAQRRYNPGRAAV